MTLIISPDFVPLFTSTTDGTVPASGGGTTNFLRADGTWQPTTAGSYLSASTTSTQDGYFTGINLLESGTTPTFYTRLINGTDLTASRTITFSLGDADRTITFPVTASSVTLATIASLPQTFAGNTTFSNATVTVGTSTAASTYGLGTGATVAAATKTINIGTSGVTNSITNINIGSQASDTTNNIYGTIIQSYDNPNLNGAPFAGITNYLQPQAGATITSVTVDVTTGIFTCAPTTLAVNQTMVLAGTNTGALITGYTNPSTYYIISTNGSTTFSLSTTQGGASISLTGTSGSTGLSFSTATGATPFGITESPFVSAQTFLAGGTVPYLWLSSGGKSNSYVAITSGNSAYTWGFTSAGAFTVPGQIQSSIATGTAPFTVASTTLVTNLNAQYVNGATTGTSGATIPLLNGTNTFSALNTFSNGITVSGATTTLTTGTATVAPITFASGTNLTTAAAGVLEYDGSFFYATKETTSGRGNVSVDHTFRLAANGTAITTIANFYGANSAINLAASAVYDIEYHAYFTKTTAGTVTFTLTASSAPTLMFALLQGTPATGVGAGAPQSLSTSSQANVSAAFGATASLTTAVNHVYLIKGRIQTNLATNLRLNIACSAGSATPLAGSYYVVRRISASQGSFAA